MPPPAWVRGAGRSSSRSGDEPRPAGLTGRLSVIGQIDTGVPLPGLPDAGGDDALRLLGPAASVALLVFSSSVLTGRSLAARDREDLDANRAGPDPAVRQPAHRRTDADLFRDQVRQLVQAASPR